VTQPLGENLDITGELHGLFLTSLIQLGRERITSTSLAWFILCSSCCRLAVAPVARREKVSQSLTLMLDVKDVSMTRCVWPNRRPA